jgi:hypothetical protein
MTGNGKRDFSTPVVAIDRNDRTRERLFYFAMLEMTCKQTDNEILDFFEDIAMLDVLSLL